MRAEQNPPEYPLYIVLVSVHGLIRGKSPELGCDADTGGQITYVLELARALGRHPGVGRVDLFTRQVFDNKVDKAYSVPEEVLDDDGKVRIIRFPCGPRRYLRKESLWPHLPLLGDNTLTYFRRIGRIPDVIHSHYADAGLVATDLARKLGVLHVHTGHSLGRVKRERLLEKGVAESTIEERYNIRCRIEAEEVTLGNADCIIASTWQEVEDQYAQYEYYDPKSMWVIPPGVDLKRYQPPERWSDFDPPIRKELHRFLNDPKKPMILALSRADERKNIHTLIQAYAENETLRQKANLVVVAGNRDDINTLDRGARKVFKQILQQLDRYDLYGSLAIPKHHAPEDVPSLYHLASKKRGVFVNPALTEPFGLTLLEAAASGLPVVATHDGGPRDILSHCRNGVLIDPLDADAMGQTLLDAISDRPRWRRWARSGLKGAHTHYSWDGHVVQYLKMIHRRLKRQHKRQQAKTARSKNSSYSSRPRTRLTTVDRILLCDLDNTLLGDAKGLCNLLDLLSSNDHVGFGIATGRSLQSALRELKRWRVPLPDFLITSVGARIFYRRDLVADSAWENHLNYRWERDVIQMALREIPGLRLQAKTEQNPHKLSYYVDPSKLPDREFIVRFLRERDLHARVVYSRNAYLDILPLRASKGLAMAYLALKWGIPLENVLAVGDSANDLDMLQGINMGVVVGNSDDPGLDLLHEDKSILFAQEHYAWGVLEGIEQFRFLAKIKNPNAVEATK
uniref:sucrose-phosphate synthase n=1 Tax=Magnetococcus massalia (strain MO-1) TaxID=451514 RepID=A0A1S7LI56_MAGMO|nr:GT4 : Sucrose-phosphate synthase [Candidatus Magnetococcus massalia]